jgi:hypothetical protein
MPVTRTQVQELVLQKFPGSDVSDIHEENDRVMGTFSWPKFQDMDIKERNRLVREEIRGTLGLDGINVGFLLPLAPGED